MKNHQSIIDRNRFARILYLIKKMYLTKSRFGHYSQFGEDISVTGMFPKELKGFFVDVGCFHPIKHNNTWKLYKRRDWRGINIDVDAIKIEGFNLIRPHDINVNCAVSNKEEEISYWTNGDYSHTSSLSSSFVSEKGGYTQKTTNSYKLTSIIDNTKYKDQKIDYLTVDAEGHDLEVLESLDFDRYYPSLIAVETYKAVLSDVEKTDLYQFLFTRGYRLIGWCGLTLLMANEPFTSEHRQRRSSL